MNIKNIDISVGIILYKYKNSDLLSKNKLIECLKSYHSYHNKKGSKNKLLENIKDCERVFKINKSIKGGADREEGNVREINEALNPLLEERLRRLENLIERQAVQTENQLNALGRQMAENRGVEHVVVQGQTHAEASEQRATLRHRRDQRATRLYAMGIRQLIHTSPEDFPDWLRIQLGRTVMNIVLSPLDIFLFFCFEIPMFLVIRPIIAAVNHGGRVFQLVWGYMLLGVIGTIVYTQWTGMSEEDRENIVSTVRTTIGFPLDRTIEFINFIYNQAFKDFVEILRWGGNEILQMIQTFFAAIITTAVSGMNPVNWWPGSTPTNASMNPVNATFNNTFSPTPQPTVSYYMPNVSMPSMPNVSMPSMPNVSLRTLLPSLVD